MRFEKDKFYFILWDDHWAYQSTWNDALAGPADLVPISVKSIGLCLGDSDQMVRLASTIDQNGRFGGDISIMKVAIKEAWELEGV